jgi:hypothetical protein
MKDNKKTEDDDRPESYFSIRRRRSRRYIKIISAIVVPIIAIGVISAIIFVPQSSLAPTIDGIQCNSLERTTYHIHAHLDVFIDGKPFTVPAQIGITGKCLYWLHTHDTTGVIHVESPDTRSYTLGDFFDIWSQTQPNSQISNQTGGDSTPQVYVNGAQVQESYRDVVLDSHEEIALVYGSKPSTIPSSYSFESGL